MTINVKKEADTLFLEVAGRLDTTTAPSLEEAVDANIAEGVTLVLDFDKLEYISSAGLRVLLGAQKKMQKLGVMKLINVCDDVMEILEMTGFSDVLTIE